MRVRSHRPVSRPGLTEHKQPVLEFKAREDGCAKRPPCQGCKQHNTTQHMSFFCVPCWGQMPANVSLSQLRLPYVTLGHSEPWPPTLATLAQATKCSGGGEARLLCRAPLIDLCPISLDYPGFTFSTQGRLCAVKQGVRHLFGRAYVSQNPIYYSWFSKGGEGENVSVTKALRGKNTLEALEKGLKSERQAAQSRLARNTGCRRCSVGVHARPRLEFN